MAAIDEVAASPNTPDLGPAAKQAISAMFWVWFYNNQDKSIKVKVWFINASVSVGQLRPLFVMLFGEERH